MRMSISPQNGGFQRWTGGSPLPSAAGIRASRSPGLPCSLMTRSRSVQAAQIPGVLSQVCAQQILPPGFIKGQQAAPGDDSGSIDRILRGRLDQLQLHPTLVVAQTAIVLMFFPFAHAADAVVLNGHAPEQQIMRPCGPRLLEGLAQRNGGRRPTHPGEVRREATASLV